MYARLLEMAHGVQHIVDIGAGPASRRSHEARLPLYGELPGILRMPPVDEVAQRLELPARAVEQADWPHGLDIDVRDLLPLAQIGERQVAFVRGHAKHHAAARAALVEPEHKAGIFRRAAMMEGVDA